MVSLKGSSKIAFSPLGAQNILQRVFTWLNATDNGLETVGCGKAVACPKK